MSKPLLMLMLFAGMLATPASQADEIKPQTQRTSRKPAITPATTSKQKPESAATAKNSSSETRNSQQQNKPPSPAGNEATLVLQEQTRSALDDLRVKPDVADKLVKEVADPDKQEGAIDRIKDIANAAGDLDIIGVDPKVRDRAVDTISRSKNPKDTAKETVGEAGTESVFGKDIAKLVPDNKRGDFREIFISLLDIQGSLEVLGAEPDAPEVVEAIKESARQGVSTRQGARIIMEKAAHKVLDRQGFTPGKPGESLNARLAAMAEEQKILQAELDAKKAAKAKADLLAQQKAKARAGNLGNSAITQGAAGSSAVGRSVSSRVTVAVGGGKSNTSGAGTAQHGTGTDATKTVGSGGQNRADMASTRLSADKGGVSNAGQPSTGSAPTPNPGGSTTPAVVTTPAGDSAPANIDTNNAPLSPILADADVNTPASSQPATTTAPNNPQADRGNPNTQVVAGGDEVLVGMNGPHVPVGTENYQTGDNSRTSTTYFADGTFEETTVTVTRDGSGNITSRTETKSTGTWAPGSRGKEQTSTTSSTSTTTSGNDTSSTSASNQNDSSNDDDDDDDEDDDKNQSEDPPPAEQASTEQTEETSSSEESKEASTTPNPMDIGGGDPSQLATSTGGRLGSQEARRQQRGLELARAGGGAAGPNPEGKGGSYTLLTPEEAANAERALNMRAGAGVTNPNPLAKDAATVTERDLKELYLRGNGGAKGPGDQTAPSKPQDPRSPVGGGTPGLAPGGGTRINASKTKSATMQRSLNGSSRIAVDGLKSNLRN
jgi:hypothetical protein